VWFSNPEYDFAALDRITVRFRLLGNAARKLVKTTRTSQPFEHDYANPLSCFPIGIHARLMMPNDGVQLVRGPKTQVFSRNKSSDAGGKMKSSPIRLGGHRPAFDFILLWGETRSHVKPSALTERLETKLCVHFLGSQIVSPNQQHRTTCANYGLTQYG
jgi:hypothetical protein